jgi:hypothetical protein
MGGAGAGASAEADALHFQQAVKLYGQYQTGPTITQPHPYHPRGLVSLQFFLQELEDTLKSLGVQMVREVVDDR